MTAFEGRFVTGFNDRQNSCIDTQYTNHEYVAYILTINPPSPPRRVLLFYVIEDDDDYYTLSMCFW